MCLKTPGQVLLLVLDTFNSEVRHPIESAQALFVRLDRTFENDVLFLTVSKLTNCTVLPSSVYLYGASSVVAAV